MSQCAPPATPRAPTTTQVPTPAQAPRTTQARTPVQVHMTTQAPMTPRMPAPAQASAPPTPPRLRLNIQRLVVPGYTWAEQARFVRALDNALQTLAATRPVGQPARRVQLAHIDAGELPQGATPEAAAQAIAAGLFANITSRKNITARKRGTGHV
jgi:hypothetical protein